MAKKRKKKARQGRKKQGYIQDGRARKLLGMLLISLAVIMFFSFISYFFSWKDDFADVRLPWSEYLFDQAYEARNFLGKLGAIIAHLFIYKGIGLMAFVLVYLLGKTGLEFLLQSRSQKIWNEWKWSIYIVVFLSVFLSFAFSGLEFNIGGDIGRGVRNFLTSFIGSIGLSLLFIFILLFMIVWLFNPDFNNLSFRDSLKRIKMQLNVLINRRVSKSDGLKSNKSETMSGDTATNRDANVKEQGEVFFNEKSDLTSKNVSSAETIEEDPEDEFQILVPDQDEHQDKSSSFKQEEFRNLEKHAEKLSVEKENEAHLEPYDPTKDLSNYRYPHLELLNVYSNEGIEFDRQELNEKKDQIVQTLLNYKIEIKKIWATIGPTVTLYEIIPAPGVKISKIKNLEDDIALSLAALGIRIIAPIPGKGTVGIEVPNKKRQIVGLRSIIKSRKFQEAKMDLPIALGKTIANEVFIADLAKMPHLLVAGATGQGKSVGINAILASILFKKHPSQVKLVLIDPKKVELSIYTEIENHFLAYLPDSEEPIITETKKVINTLNSLCIEMDDRYNLLKKGRARNIKEYNKKFTKRQLNPQKGHRFLPFIVLVIDEFADLIMTAGKEIELPIGRLAQLARAVGIHLIIATQRPSVNIITGLIKANFPARLAFKVTSKVDSRTILDTGGADQLVGQGDMLLSVGGKMVRLQCAFIDTLEVEGMVEFIADQQGFPTPFFLPEYVGEDEEDDDLLEITVSDLDEYFDDAARLMVQTQRGSTSSIQRKMKLGYNRAGRIMDQMEHFGIVGPARGSKPREVLFSNESELERHLEMIRND